MSRKKRADVGDDPPRGDVVSPDRIVGPALSKPFMHRPQAQLAIIADVSEDTIARAFTEQYGDTLKFDHSTGFWYEWDGFRWRKDRRHRAFHWARLTARQQANGKSQMGKANVAGGIERFARSDPAHAITADQWDSDPMLLGTPDGTIDLQTGELHDADPSELITKSTGCGPGDGVPTVWFQFLRQVAHGDTGLMRFIQQCCGYLLTGDTREHALFFIHGPGGNGKSVFLNTINAILGDYAATAAMETFTASPTERHSTELAMLNGARLVSAAETEEGRAWAEARIKLLTGGDPITARFMRQDNFTFIPQFKLLIVGNHAPKLHNVDDAMRRRLNFIPFMYKPTVVDRQLYEKLRGEHDQILTWMLVGCRDWLENGLVRPASVIEATNEYFLEQDNFGQWIEARCERGPENLKCFQTAAQLYADWCDYATGEGHLAGTSKAFGINMRRHDMVSKIARVHGEIRRIYVGIRLRSEG